MLKEAVLNAKKKMREKSTTSIIDWSKGLSTGSTLFNLAMTGRSDVGYLPGNCYLLVGDSQSGKAQPLTSKILTSTGWKYMGSIKVGDEVIDPDGGVGIVQAVYPQGKKDVYQLLLSDGATVECCEDHLWLLKNGNDKRRGTTRIKKIPEIISSIESGHESLFVPLVKPVEFSVFPDLPIPPYLLGVLLGNGHFGNDSVRISSREDEIIDKVRLLIPSDHILTKYGKGDYEIYFKRGHKNQLLEATRVLGLSGCRAINKFIPKSYFYASVKDRVTLLQGLMDTDGFVDKRSGLEYSTISKKLAMGVVTLIRSLGGSTSIRSKVPTYTYRGERRIGQKCYTISLRLPNDIIPLTLTRKVERVRKQPTRKIVSVLYVGVKKCQCISVSTKRGLYVTDNYIVTHNTWVALSTLAEASINPVFAKYDLIYDAPERGACMDIGRYFGKRLVSRIKEFNSETVEDFYDSLDDLLDKGKPFIYVEDSESALSSEDARNKYQEQKEARRRGKVSPGSYGDGKAKKHSSMLREVVASKKFYESGSILILISQTRDNIGFGAQFNPKTRAGGRALKFYAHSEAWFSIKEQIKEKVLGKKRKIGTVLQVQIKKNRDTGWEPTIELLHYPSVGIDDLGSMCAFLVDEGVWEEVGGKIIAPQFDFEGSMSKLIRKIEEDGDLQELKVLVIERWLNIETACSIERKNRYV